MIRNLYEMPFGQQRTIDTTTDRPKAKGVRDYSPCHVMPLYIFVVRRRASHFGKSFLDAHVVDHTRRKQAILVVGGQLTSHSPPFTSTALLFGGGDISLCFDWVGIS